MVKLQAFLLSVFSNQYFTAVFPKSLRMCVWRLRWVLNENLQIFKDDLKNPNRLVWIWEPHDIHLSEADDRNYLNIKKQIENNLFKSERLRKLSSQNRFFNTRS